MHDLMQVYAQVDANYPQVCFIGLLDRIQKLTGAVEKLSDENSSLRKQAGLAPAHEIELSGVQLAKVMLVHGVMNNLKCLENQFCWLTCFVAIVVKSVCTAGLIPI